MALRLHASLGPRLCDSVFFPDAGKKALDGAAYIGGGSLVVVHEDGKKEQSVLLRNHPPAEGHHTRKRTGLRIQAAAVGQIIISQGAFAPGREEELHPL